MFMLTGHKFLVFGGAGGAGVHAREIVIRRQAQCESVMPQTVLLSGQGGNHGLELLVNIGSNVP